MELFLDVKQTPSPSPNVEHSYTTSPLFSCLLVSWSVPVLSTPNIVHYLPPLTVYGLPTRTHKTRTRRTDSTPVKRSK